MVEFLPPENNAMSSLLAVIADPKKAQARLDDISKQQMALNSRVEEANRSEKAAREAKAEAEKARDEQLALNKHNEEDLVVMRQKLLEQSNDYTKAYQEHQQRVEMFNKGVDEVRKLHSAKEIELGNKENAVTQRELAVSVRETEAESKYTEYNDKLTKLKAVL